MLSRTALTTSHRLPAASIPFIRTFSVPIFLVLLLLAWLVQHILLRNAGFQSLTADEFGRAVLAAQWADHPFLLSYGARLPLHIYLLGAALWVHWNLLLTPQIVAICFGLVSLVLIYQLGKLLTGVSLVGLLSATLLAINPAHVWISAGPLSEGMFTLLWLAGLCLVLSFHMEMRPLRIIGAGLMFGVANGVRYEGWFVSLFFSLYVAIVAASYIRERRHDPGVYVPLIASLVLCWSFPIIWMVQNARATGDMLYWMHSVSSYKLRWYGVERQLGNYLHTALRIDPFILATALSGLVALWNTRGFKAFAPYLLMALAPLGVFIVLHGGQSVSPGNYLRYLAPFVFVSYPLMAYGLFLGAQWARRFSRPLAASILVVLLAGIGA